MGTISSGATAIVDSYLANCHKNDGEGQGPGQQQYQETKRRHDRIDDLSHGLAERGESRGGGGLRLTVVGQGKV